MSRLGKQFLYGSFFLLVLAGIGGMLYLTFLPAQDCRNGRHDWGEEGVDCGGACGRACIPSDLKPLRANATHVFGAGTVLSALVEVQNPNQYFSAKDLGYSVEFFDAAGASLGIAQGESFVYAGEIKRLAVFGSGSGKPARATAALSERQWVPAAELARPEVALLDHRTEAAGRSIRTEGRLVNRDPGRLSEVRVAALYFQAGRPAGVSETILQDVEPGETRGFTVIYPSTGAIQTERTELFISAKRP